MSCHVSESKFKTFALQIPCSLQLVLVRAKTTLGGSPVLKDIDFLICIRCLSLELMLGQCKTIVVIVRQVFLRCQLSVVFYTKFHSCVFDRFGVVQIMLAELR